jgi:hypothetical protein
VGLAAGSATEGMSFDVPSLSTLHLYNRAATGSTSVTVTGSFFGVRDFTMRVRSGQTAQEASDWHSDTSVAVRVAHGTGGSLRVIVTAGHQEGTVTEAATYDIRRHASDQHH